MPESNKIWFIKYTVLRSLKVSCGGQNEKETSDSVPTVWDEFENEYVAMPESEIAETRNVTAAKSTSYCCTVKDDYGNEKDVYFYIHIGGVYSYPEGNEDTRKNRIAITAEKRAARRQLRL